MKITIVGCGNMGKAFATRLKGHTLFLYDHFIEKSNALSEFGLPCQDAKAAINQSDIIILAVKPQSFDEASQLFQNTTCENKILISILTGVSIEKLREKIPYQTIVRMMPNLPLIYGEGLLGVSIDKPLNSFENEQLVELIKPLGKMHFLEEKKMNAFTSLAGSGPGFVFSMIQSMIDAGVELGFTNQESTQLVLQMVKGSVHLMEKSGKDTDELIKQIATPNGTTRAGLDKYEELGVNEGIKATFLAAYVRANELS